MVAQPAHEYHQGEPRIRARHNPVDVGVSPALPEATTHDTTPETITVLLILTAALGVAACGAPSHTPSTTPLSNGTAPTDRVPAAQAPIPRCEDVPFISAPAEAYRDTPIYVGNEMPIDDIREWAIRQPGYADIWIDRAHNGWVTVAFSQDAAARQRDLDREFPDVGAVTVQVPWTGAQLEALQRRVQEALPPGVVDSSGSLVMQGVVMIGVGVLTPERVALVEAAFAGQPVCLEGVDPADVPAPGPQQPAGDGWRLLATEPTGQPYRTGIAWDDASLADLWAVAGVQAPVPEADFASEVVIWFGAVYSGSCPDIRLNDVVIDDGRRLVDADIVLVDPPGACTADANPRAYLVAVPRTRLPAPTFAIQLGSDAPPGGAPEERTLVEADLRTPGSVAAPEQVHQDPSLMQPDPQIASSGDTIETDISNLYRLSVHCGVEWLGTLNGVTWRTDMPAGVQGRVPPAWDQVVAMDQSIILDIVMSPGPEPTVTATANGLTLVYRPAAEAAPGCD